MQFLSDTFTESADVALDAHVGETGATWTKHSGTGVATVAASTDRLRISATGGRVVYYASGLPVGADYEVSAPVLCASTVASRIGVSGRVDVTAITYYCFFHDTNLDQWIISKVIADAPTDMATYAQTLVASSTYVARLSMVGTQLKGYVDDVERVSVTDSSIAAAGRAGTFGYTGVASGAGVQLVEITATDIEPRRRTLVGVGQ